MKKLFSFSVVLLLLGWIHAAMAANDPVEVLRTTANQMIQNLQANRASLKTNPRLVYSLAYRIVVPHADLAEMSKRVLPAHIWNSASPAQRQQFEKEFTLLLVRTYASALADYTNETVNFYPVRGGYQGKSAVKVESQIVRTDGPSIPVNYRMLNSGGQWKLYDMSVEGISLLESFRSQFADKLAQGNMQSLLNDLAAHNRCS